MPPKSEPVPSAQAPKPHGILKNIKPSDGANVDNRLQWDESNLSLNQEERDNAAARMTIDEPKTPFVHSASAPPMEEEEFDLDTDKDARPVATSASLDLDQVEANTKANAAISGSYRQLKERVESSPTIASPTPTYPTTDGDEAKHTEP
ncbi:uncharacterized protein MJAP1_002952 [Malassezia japonica]|uniref:Uncharacterized protein n=1 Tax=Malassezia japonica TaxID=223818 RepID=A0AAF0EZP0_9BASI|nr:uncharacterized protein MJAP1_002952 [Malassezia japonica]WFD39970.1 hypothetical protein MJAP1_002952 [Malassezia japonica]